MKDTEGVQFVLQQGDDEYEDDFEMEDGEHGNLQQEEVFAAEDGSGNTDSTNKWDQIISALEEVLIDQAFERTRINFCQQHCHEFEDTAENKLVYTQLHEAYCNMLEGTIEAALSKAVPGFSMAEFADMLAARQDQLGAEVFDLLLSLSDFSAFKDLMLDTRRELEGGQAQQAAHADLICSTMPVHHEEQEDGEERPDLDMSLEISPLVSSGAAAAAGGKAPGNASSKLAGTAAGGRRDQLRTS